ncbi:hypothetical protein M3398_27670 [Streptomyces albidoflavus]|uniref:hypothetical protein n=1 Tax=Streptomyces TaxID=1883 RepID=UPI0020BD8AF0|nr:hypothetical protein [Streptomyces albidoflavus]MCL6281048.1 hypothetical protein [Streptomyces albidoflavus]
MFLAGGITNCPNRQQEAAHALADFTVFNHPREPHAAAAAPTRRIVAGAAHDYLRQADVRPQLHRAGPGLTTHHDARRALIQLQHPAS